jgi:hypothetical protein
MALGEDVDARRTLCPVITHSDPAAFLSRAALGENRTDMDDVNVPVRSASSSLTQVNLPKHGLGELRTVGPHHWHGKGM